MEFALVVPLLLMIVFGAFSGAVAFNNKQDIVYAAREGARYGATVPQSQCTPTANCGGKTWAQLVQAVVVQRSDGEINASEVCAALVSGSPGTVASAPFTTKADGTSCYNDGERRCGASGPGLRLSCGITQRSASCHPADHVESSNCAFRTMIRHRDAGRKRNAAPCSCSPRFF